MLEMLTIFYLITLIISSIFILLIYIYHNKMFKSWEDYYNKSNDTLSDDFGVKEKYACYDISNRIRDSFSNIGFVDIQVVAKNKDIESIKDIDENKKSSWQGFLKIISIIALIPILNCIVLLALFVKFKAMQEEFDKYYKSLEG